MNFCACRCEKKTLAIWFVADRWPRSAQICSRCRVRSQRQLDGSPDIVAEQNPDARAFASRTPNKTPT